jgi:thiol-disulfide isomerase/thioredoxin
MKALPLISILIMILFINCSRDENSPKIDINGSSYIKLDVSNIHDSIYVETRTVSMFPFGERTKKNVLMTENKTVFLKYDISIPALIEFEVNMDKIFRTYLIPNDTVTISVEQVKIDSVHYETKYTCDDFVYQYFHEKHNALGFYQFLDEYAKAEQYWYNPRVTEEVHRKGMLVVDSLQTKSNLFLKNYSKKLPDWFIDFEKANIQYSAAYCKIMLQGGLTNFKQKDDLIISDSFYNMSAELSNHYYSFIQLYLTYGYPSAEDPILRLIKIFNDEYKNIGSMLKGDIKDYFITCYIRNLYSYCYSEKQIIEIDEFIKTVDFKLPSEVIQNMDQKRLSLLSAFNAMKSTSVGTAPDFSAKDKNGITHNLSDFKGKKVYLHFWATWCGACRAELPSLNDFASKIDTSKVVIVNVCLDNEIYKFKKIITDAKLSGLNLICDEKLNRELTDFYNISYVPYYVLIDENGLLEKNPCTGPTKMTELIASNLKN